MIWSWVELILGKSGRRSHRRCLGLERESSRWWWSDSDMLVKPSLGLRLMTGFYRNGSRKYGNWKTCPELFLLYTFGPCATFYPCSNAAFWEQRWWNVGHDNGHHHQWTGVGLNRPNFRKVFNFFLSYLIYRSMIRIGFRIRLYIIIFRFYFKTYM